MLSLYGRRPLCKRLHKIETAGIITYLQRLPTDELKAVYRRMAAQSESFARQLREWGYYDQVFEIESQEEPECE